MIRTAVQISNRSSLSIPRLSLKTGDILPAKVISQISSQNYNLAFRGITVPVNSQVPLTPGESVLLEFSDAAEVLKFRFLQIIRETRQNSQMSALLSRLGLPKNEFTRTALNLAISYQLPLIGEQLSSLFKFWKKYAQDSNSLPEQLLEHYFFQQATVDSRTLSDPLLFVRWFWGRFTLRKEIERWRSGNRKNQGDPNSNENESAGSEKKLNPILNRLTLPSTQKVLGFSLGLALNSDEVLNLYGTLEPDIDTIQNYSAKTESSSRMLNALVFLQTQLIRFKHGLWASLPYSAAGQERFFFLRKASYPGKNNDFQVHFTVETRKFGNVWVNVIKKMTHIRLEIKNPDQGFHRATDNKVASLQNRLNSAGIEKISVSHVMQTPQHSIINKILISERRLMERKI